LQKKLSGYSAQAYTNAVPPKYVTAAAVANVAQEFIQNTPINIKNKSCDVL